MIMYGACMIRQLRCFVGFAEDAGTIFKENALGLTMTQRAFLEIICSSDFALRVAGIGFKKGMSKAKRITSYQDGLAELRLMKAPTECHQVFDLLGTKGGMHSTGCTSPAY